MPTYLEAAQNNLREIIEDRRDKPLAVTDAILLAQVQALIAIAETFIQVRNILNDRLPYKI